MIFERKAYLNYLVGCEGNGMTDYYSQAHQAKASDDFVAIVW